MSGSPRTWYRPALYGTLVLALLAGCSKKDDAAPRPRRRRREGSRRTEHRRGQGDRRGRLHLRLADRDELRGHVRIRGRPDSGQFKAPFNEINNEARVFTYKDTAIVTPNSDTPYSFAVDGPARRADRALGAGGREERYYSVQLATATPSTTATSAAAPPATRPATTWSPGPTGRARRRRASRRCSAPRRILVAAYRTQLFNPADMANVEKVQAGYKVQPLSAFLKQPAPPAAPPSTSRRSTRRW